MTYLRCTLSMAYLLTKRYLAVNVITELHELIRNPRLTPGCTSQDKFFLLAFVIQLGVYNPILVYEVSTFMKHPTLYSAKRMCETVLQLLTNGPFVSFFYWTIHLMSGMYINMKTFLFTLNSDHKDIYKKKSHWQH